MVVSGQLHTPNTSCPRKESRYPMITRLGGPQSWSWRFGKRKHLASAGIQTPDHPARSPVTIPTTLTRTLANSTWEKFIQYSTFIKCPKTLTTEIPKPCLRPFVLRDFPLTPLVTHHFFTLRYRIFDLMPFGWCPWIYVSLFMGIKVNVKVHPRTGHEGPGGE